MVREHCSRFGVRCSVECRFVTSGAVTTSRQSPRSVLRRGLATERFVVQFAARRDSEVAFGALALEAIVRESTVAGSDQLASELERVTAGAHEFAEVRLLNALRAGAVKGVKAVESEEMERLLGAEGPTPTARLGLDGSAGDSEVRTALQNAIGRWQRRAENPLSSRDLADASRVLIAPRGHAFRRS